MHFPHLFFSITCALSCTPRFHHPLSPEPLGYSSRKTPGGFSASAMDEPAYRSQIAGRQSPSPCKSFNSRSYKPPPASPFLATVTKTRGYPLPPLEPIVLFRNSNQNRFTFPAHSIRVQTPSFRRITFSRTIFLILFTRDPAS
jgi:hypothetical protein